MVELAGPGQGIGRAPWWIIAVLLLSLTTGGRAMAVDEPPAAEVAATPAPIFGELDRPTRRSLDALRGVWDRLPDARRREILNRLDRWQALSPAEQARLAERISNWQSRPALERARLRERFRRFEELSPAQRKQLRAARARFEGLSPAEQAVVREQFKTQREAAAETVDPLDVGFSGREADKLRTRIAGLEPDRRRRLRRHVEQLDPEARRALRQQLLQADEAGIRRLIDSL